MRLRLPASPRSRRPVSGKPAVDLESFSQKLDDLRARALAAVVKADDPPELDAGRERLPRPQGRAARTAGRRSASSRDRTAPRSARWPIPSVKSSKPRWQAGGRGSSRSLCEVRLAREKDRRHAARARAVARLAPPIDRDRARDRAHLRPVRLRDLREAGGGDRRAQLPAAQHAARPPGARPVGHDLRRPTRIAR